MWFDSLKLLMFFMKPNSFRICSKIVGSLPAIVFVGGAPPPDTCHIRMRMRALRMSAPKHALL